MKTKIKITSILKPFKELFSFEGLLSLYVLSGLFKSIVAYYGLEPLVDITLVVFIFLVIIFFNELLRQRISTSINISGFILTGLWILFYLWMLTTLLYTPSDGYAYTKVFKYGTNVIFIIVIIRNQIDIQRFIRISLLLSFIIMAWYLPLRFLYFTGNSPKGYQYTRTYMGMYLSLSMPLGLFIITLITTDITFSRRKNLNYLAIAAGISGLLLMGARGPLLFMGLTLLLFLLTRRRISVIIRHHSVNIIITVFITVALAYIIFGTQINELLQLTFRRLSLLFNGLTLPNRDFGNSVNQRFELIRQSINIIFSSPRNILFGTGIGSFGLLTIGEDIRYYPHNFILEIWTELGLTGIILFSGMIIMVFKKIMINQKDFNFFPLLYITLNFMKSGNLEDMRLLFVFLAMYFIKTSQNQLQ